MFRSSRGKGIGLVTCKPHAGQEGIVELSAPSSSTFRRYYYETELHEWLNLDGHDTYNVDAGTIVFDQAYVLNGLHPTTSRNDPNPDPHVTVRLSNSELRQQNSWYIFYWRPNSSAWVIMPRPDNEEANRQRRQKRKDKKKRQQERKNAKKDGKDSVGCHVPL
ncbi:hypothetical protein OCU04_012426 [Sclerotinia nivalis]|uniref:Uncharacterized protein n=1 Tax=Sclerotinia nivalis TaxID=352851 RepID=A0A9X0DD85_9HELO|nr:hypothetical protein OCU04_012426 [Sclerotinia nivalis]